MDKAKDAPGTLRKLFPGVALAAVIAIAADRIASLPFAPFTLYGKDGHSVHPVEEVLLAILLGIALSNLARLPKSIAPGANYCLKSVLALGIVLMGSKLDFFDVMKLGGLSAVLVLILIALALAVSTRFARLLKVEDKLSILIAIGCTICGGTAIAAAAPVIEAEDKDVAFAVGTITVLGVAAMFLYPAISNSAGLTDVGFGIWAGTSIHNTPQVVAAGIMHSPLSGDVATAVKMIRNLFIAPTVVLFGYLFRSRREAVGESKIACKGLFPTFVLGFILMALFRTVTSRMGLVGNAADPRALWPLFRLLRDGSTWVIIVAMAGIGLTTNLRDMKELGFRPFVTGLITSVVVACVSLALIFAFRLNGVLIAG